MPNAEQLISNILPSAQLRLKGCKGVSAGYLHVGLGSLLQAARDDEVQDGDYVALVACHSAPQALYLQRKRAAMLPGDIVEAFQQLFAPVACSADTRTHG